MKQKLFIRNLAKKSNMKRKITLLLIAASSVFKMNSQVVFQEDFTSTFNPATNGWSIQNLSASANPTLAWFQGNPAVFNAYNGAGADYVGANFNSTTDSNNPATLSTWLLTPTLNLINGAVLEFATRTSTNPASFPDRLEVYMSTAGTGTNCGNSPTTVGTFSTLLVSVNPSLTTTGYPGVWTVYTVAISGVPVSTLGKIGFRYFVTNGGPAATAANSNYIGLDGVKLSLPCNQPSLTINQTAAGVCAGGTVGLTASTSGTVSVSGYTWSSGQTSASIVVSPTVTTIYTISGASTGGCVGSQTAAVTVTAVPNVVASSYTVCSSPATTATLTATGATSYSWSTGATTASISVTPGSTTVYTVTGYGAGGNCPSDQTATVTLGAQLSLNVSANSNSVCSGGTVTLSASSAATTYSWNTGATTPVITVTPGATTTYTVAGISGTIPNVCAGSNTITITVAPTPTINATLNPTAVCTGASYTLNASGANNYYWFNTPTTAFTVNPLSLTAGSAGPRSYTLVGVAANGCVDGLLINFTVSPNPTVTVVASKTIQCINGTVVLTASGADNYSWTGATTSSSNPLTYSAGTTAGLKTFSVIGTTAAGCTSTLAVVQTVSVSLCTGIENQYGNVVETSVFPNPFTNELKIGGLNGSVQVYNSLGQVIINTRVNDTETINTSELAKGVYILKAFNNEGQELKTVKLLKN